MSAELDLAGIRARAEAATPGPWLVDDRDEDDVWQDGHAVYVDDSGPGTVYIADQIRQGRDEGAADAVHIAGMDPVTTLALVYEVERLRAVVAAVRNAIDFRSFGVEVPGAREQDSSHNGAHDVVTVSDISRALEATS